MRQKNKIKTTHKSFFKKKIKLTIAACLAGLLLLGVTVIIVVGGINKQSTKLLVEESLLNFGFVTDANSMAMKDQGTKIHYNENVAVGMRYPKFSDTTLDALTATTMDNILNDFLAETRTYLAPSSQQRAMLTVDYEIIFFGEHSASILYHINTKTYGFLSDIPQSITSLYDLL